MRKLIAAVALVAALATPAFAAGGYTGQIVQDGVGRSKVVIVRKDDTISRLFRHWCREYYPGRCDWTDFVGHVQALNPGKNLDRLQIGETLHFPLTLGVSEALVNLDWEVSTAKKENAKLKEGNAALSNVVAEQQGAIAFLRAQMMNLRSRLGNMMLLNRELFSTNRLQREEIASQKSTIINYQFGLGASILIIIGGVVGLMLMSRREQKENDAGKERTAHVLDLVHENTDRAFRAAA